MVWSQRFERPAEILLMLYANVSQSTVSNTACCFPGGSRQPCARTDLFLEMEALLKGIVDGGPVDSFVSVFRRCAKNMCTRAYLEGSLTCLEAPGKILTHMLAMRLMMPGISTK